jgi:twinkle protein
MNATPLTQITHALEMLKGGHRHEQRGYFALSELPQKPEIGDAAISPGWDVLAELWKIYPGQFTIVTGTPGHGKSTLVLNVVCNIARTHGYRSFLYVPENEAFLQYKLRRIYGGHGFADFAQDQCFVQSAEVQSYDQQPRTLGWVLDRAVVGIRRDGVRLLVIDPWNELEHAKPRDLTMTDYIRECLMYLKQFVRAYNVAVILVAHPTKSHAGDNRKPTLYDVEGSAAWFNKCDNGLIVHRDAENNSMTVISAKVRERGAGKRGECLLLVNDQEQVTDLSGVTP